MVFFKTLTVLVAAVTLAGANKSVGYFEYQYSLQRDHLLEKEKEFSRCCEKLTAVKLTFLFLDTTKTVLNKQA